MSGVPAACPVCGHIIAYMGRRDMLEHVMRAESMLRDVVLEDPQASVLMRVAMAWDVLFEAECAALGVCAQCNRPAEVRAKLPVAPPVRSGTCSDCRAEGRGIGTESRCPVLGCPGSIVPAD